MFGFADARTYGAKYDAGLQESIMLQATCRSNRARTLGDMIRRQALLLGDKPAMRFEDRATSYADLYERAQRVAAQLHLAQLGSERRIAYFGKNTTEYYEILLGAAMAGVVLVPINCRLTDREIGWQLEDCRARLLFLDIEFLARQDALTSSAPSVEQLIIVGDAETLGPHSYERWIGCSKLEIGHIQVSPEDVVVQLYTSGTTGTPKGAMLSHRALLAFRDLPREEQPSWQQWLDTDVGMIVMPQFHIGGTGFGLQLLCAGATGQVVRDFQTTRVLEFIERFRLTKLFTVPSALRMLLDDPLVSTIDHSSLQTIIYGASPIAPALLRQAMNVFKCGFVQQYGMTEVCGTICVLDQEDHQAALHDEVLLRSAGRPLRGVDIVIVDGARNRLPPGTRGEIAIRTPTMMSAYWNRPEESAACITADGFFLTGDVGYVDERGYLFVRDRLTDMIVTGGENVYPAEVEAILSQHPAVADVAIVGVPDSRWGEAVKAIVVPKSDARLDHEMLVTWGRTRLASYKLPKSTEFVSALPRSAVGKVLRRKLRDSYWKADERST